MNFSASATVGAAWVVAAIASTGSAAAIANAMGNTKRLLMDLSGILISSDSIYWFDLCANNRRLPVETPADPVARLLNISANIPYPRLLNAAGSKFRRFHAINPSCRRFPLSAAA
jgi:hypothetical protein